MRQNVIITLVAAFACGFGFANFIGLYKNYSQSYRYPPYDNHATESEPDPDSHETFNTAEGTNLSAPTNSSVDPTVQVADDVQAESRLANQVRVLCWVMTTPANHEKKAIHVKNTWGKRCNKLLFMSSQADEQLGAIGLPNVKEGREWLWAKATGAFKYIWEHHRDEADWFMKADDDTYIILENLRYMLSQFQADNPIYFGCRFQLPSNKMNYMSGGAGYVLSKEALRRLVEQALPDKDKCKQLRKKGEDVEIGHCLEAVGVEAGDSRDALGRYRFLPFPPRLHLFPGAISNTSWYWKWIYYPQTRGMECCSDRAISFHYMEPRDMYAMEYLIYHLRRYDTSQNYTPPSSTL